MDGGSGRSDVRATVGAVKLVKQGDGNWLEQYDTKSCPGCGADWTPGRGGYSLGTLPCECAGTMNHRILKCRSCPTEVTEPPHRPQEGPTASYGRSTHRPSD